MFLQALTNVNTNDDAQKVRYKRKANQMYEYILDFLVGYILSRTQSYNDFGSYLLAFTLSDATAHSIPTSRLRKFMSNPFECPRLTAIHCDLHEYYEKHTKPKANTKHDLFAFKSTGVRQHNSYQAVTLKPSCPMHDGASTKCPLEYTEA
mmetsp:Transcript_41365/g.127864  ORF Transcript_41365/g.127864 Transcript_41365/m.127864 type:complete len:150 (+) Transcript_41365:675-1124(+)